MNKKNLKKIVELEERLMDLLEIVSIYDGIPTIYFDIQINEILSELEELDGD